KSKVTRAVGKLQPGQNESTEPILSTVNPSEPALLLKQVFITVTKKHNILNNANINNQGNYDVKYQSGPSFEVTIAPQVYGTLQDSGNGMDIARTPPVEDPCFQEDSTPQDIPSQLINTLGQALPQQALPDQIQGNLAQASHALSDFKQFDQAQMIEQTLYQPSSPTEALEAPEDKSPEEPEESGSGCSGCCGGSGHREH
ncbi:hypothetical protein K7432_015455, partial [Basidiobolus ranarum]